MPTSRTQEAQARIDLAAAFRWAARLDMHESIANHFSVALSDDGKQFLLNPVGRHFSRMRASELLLLDAQRPATLAFRESGGREARPAKPAAASNSSSRRSSVASNSDHGSWWLRAQMVWPRTLW